MKHEIFLYFISPFKHEILKFNSLGVKYSSLFNTNQFFLHHLIKLVMKQWIGDWDEWESTKMCKRSVIILSRILLIPIIILSVIFLPNSNLTKRWSTPLNKFISSLASYLIFLWLTFTISNADKRKQLRGPPDTGEYIVFSIELIIQNIFLFQGMRHF